MTVFMQRCRVWCIIILAFNEEKTIEETVSLSIQALQKISNQYSVLIVDDGSTDHTTQVICELKEKFDCVKFIRHDHNKGYGESLRTGYLNFEGDIVAAIPSDMQFNPMDLVKLAPLLETYDIVVTYRKNRTDFNFRRKLISFIDKCLARILFNLKLRDLHWVKLYKSSILSNISLSSRSSSVDTEILYKAMESGAKVVEVSLQDSPRVFGKAKGASIKNILGSIIDLLKLRVSK